MRKSCVCMFILAAAASAVLTVAQTDPSKRPSPPGTAEFTLHGKKLTVEYSRPSMRGRKIFGDLLAYGEVWRTGANKATTFTTEAALNLGGVTVPAGKYTLYSIPSEATWKLIINKQTGQWGTAYDQKQDLARIDMKTERIEIPIEQFLISFLPKGKDGATLRLDWEKTRAQVDIKVPKIEATTK
ncbi:MAG: DUF2911 domain-containing protein [Terriglobales bacterium]